MIYFQESLLMTYGFVQIKKLYYLAEIFLNIYFECESPKVTKVAKGVEHLYCSSCGGKTNLSKKCLR